MCKSKPLGAIAASMKKAGLLRGIQPLAFVALSAVCSRRLFLRFGGQKVFHELGIELAGAEAGVSEDRLVKWN